MVGEDLELLITVVVAADDERQARAACAGLLRRVGGQVVQAGDCSDEEPGCWSVTVSRSSGERATQNVAGALARAVRTFVRSLGEQFPMPRVACEPPTAWTVLEDPGLLDELVPGAERLLVEAWAGGDPQRRDAVPEPDAGVAAEPEAGTRLLLRVDVATDRSAGAEWQARAVASRVARSGKITRVAPNGHLLSVHVDLGSSVNSPTVALLDAVSSLGRSGWTPVRWAGDSATTRWSALPVPPAGITELELTATPASAFVWTVPD
ncbi:hypothetical protein ABZ816_06375 [Actinosynnema sp. NPDC047251]|uniref:Uncharacterized protein n=1 Tax=Saccharothrix espanaensis (strain ATCC 51144 / DSM 44229 / JCM 9112 / NBRC 15066 / NRRL 15764) TaxID=1179773 RepID=K0JNX0_SACES|nr:hypothetical protein [Saccharothrix espanaensis]CCH27920.1 hypothetical protein BN6_05910 [Saccharothrix espanaensis DSM 44229]